MSDKKKVFEETSGRRSGSSPALAEWMQEKLDNILRETGITAVCAAVCAEGELLAAACAGTRGFEDSEARGDDLYNIGSVSKVYVTAAIMELVQEGKVCLDESVNTYLPDWKLADERYREITVRMLLNHSSGIPGTNLHDHLVPEEGEALFTGKYRNTPEYWGSMKLRARPGSFSSYSNDGFDLLAEVVEAVTGEPYIQWLREEIALPAGLSSVGAGRRLAEGYVKVSSRGNEPEYYNCFGAGAIHTTIPECALFGSLFIDSHGIIGQDCLDETRRPQGVTFLQGAYDASNFCLGWDSLYTRNRIPLGEGAVVKDGGTEQFESYLLVSPARRLSLAVAATSDGDIWWLEVLEDIGREALKVLEEEQKGEAEHGDRAGADRNPQETGEGAEKEESGEAGSAEKEESVEAGSAENGESREAGSAENEESVEAGSAENEEAGEQAKASAAVEPGMEEKVPLDISRKYSGLAYGSCRVYHFSVCENTLNTEILEEGVWKKEEELSDFQWDGKCFAKGEYDKILAEEYNGNIYYIRWGEAFCQKNSGYPAPGTLWPRLVGTCFTAEGEDAVFHKICLEAVNEENVLLFTTDHEEYLVVPLVCDPRKENETCLISETDRDGIVFRLEQEGEQLWLCTGTDRYRADVG